MDLFLAKQCNERHSESEKKEKEEIEGGWRGKKRQGKIEEEREERKKEERSALFIPQ